MLYVPQRLWGYLYINEHLLSTDLVPGAFLNAGNSKINMT